MEENPNDTLEWLRTHRIKVNEFVIYVKIGTKPDTFRYYDARLYKRQPWLTGTGSVPADQFILSYEEEDEILVVLNAIQGAINRIKEEKITITIQRLIEGKNSMEDDVWQ